MQKVVVSAKTNQHKCFPSTKCNAITILQHIYNSILIIHMYMYAQLTQPKHTYTWSAVQASTIKSRHQLRQLVAGWAASTVCTHINNNTMPGSCQCPLYYHIWHTSPTHRIYNVHYTEQNCIAYELHVCILYMHVRYIYTDVYKHTHTHIYDSSKCVR